MVRDSKAHAQIIAALCAHKQVLRMGHSRHTCIILEGENTADVTHFSHVLSAICAHGVNKHSLRKTVLVNMFARHGIAEYVEWDVLHFNGHSHLRVKIVVCIAISHSIRSSSIMIMLHHTTFHVLRPSQLFLVSEVLGPPPLGRDSQRVGAEMFPTEGAAG
eukprot:2414927-Pyramimonas_sp.AAC.1